MYLKQQYLDYELYKSNRLSDLYFNNAKELNDNFENVEQTYGDIAILYHQALLINKNNIDAASDLTKMIDDGKITVEQSTELRKVAFSKLKNRNKEVANLNIDDSDVNPDLIDFTPPIFKFAKVTTDLKKIVQVEFDEPIKENSNISPNDFQLFINNNYTLISNVTVDSSGILLLHLSRDVREGKTLNLKYIRDLNNTNNNVTDRNNNVLVSFGPVQVINLVDTTPPYFINGKVTNDNPNIIELSFTETMNNNLNFNKNTFTVNIGGYEVDIKDVNINDKKINITLFNNIISTQTILISYQKTNNIFENLTDLVGNELFSFINQELENEVVPLYKSGVVNDDFPNKIFIDFDGSILSTTQFNLNDFSVSVEGITVDISSITVNIEQNLTIELKNNIKTNETIILSYTKSNISSNNIVDENNNPVDTFIDKIIENLIAPIFDNGFVSNEVNNIITINFNGVIKEISQDIDLTTTPDFTVKIDGQSKMIKEILVQNGNVTLSTREYISSMQSISIIYLKNKGRPEKNLVNEQDIPIRSFTANIENRVAPVLIKKTVENDTSNNITLEFDVDVTCSNIKPENFQTNIKGYKYTDFPIVEYSTHSQSILNIIDAQIVNGDIVLDFDGIVAAGAEGYVQYIDPGNNSDEKITDLCGNRLRTNSLIYPSYHPTEPYNWITNKVEPQLIGAEIVQYVTNETNNQEYYQGILLKFNPHSIDNLSNAVSYEIFVNNANTSSGIDDNIFFETTNQRFTNSPQKTLLVIMKDEYNITDTLSLKYYQNNNNYIEYTNYQKFIDYREYNMSEYNTNVDKLIVTAIGDIPIINKLPPLFSSGEATNADFKRIILKFNSTLANKTISPGNFLVKINDISQNIAEVGVFDNSNALYIKMSNQIPDESTIQVIYTRDTINSFNNIQGIYQNDVAGFDTETNIINTIDSKPPEILSLTTTNSNTISLQLNEPLIENNINDDILNIHIDEVLADISSVVIDTSNIQIVIHENITSMQNLTLTYDATQKDGPYVSDILGNVLHYPNPTPITNTIPPVYTSSTTIYNGYISNNKTIQLLFDVDISQNTDTDLCGNDFDLTIDGVSQDINSISIVNGKVQIVTIDDIVSMQDISFKYTQSDISTSHMRDQNGNSVISFTARKTIQNTIPPFFYTLYPPRITNVEPFKIRIPFNVPLTNNIYNNNLLPSSFSLQLYTQPILLPFINSVEISDGDVIINYTTTNSGKPKINDLFVLSYTKPSNSLNQIKDDNGNSIENFGRNSFSSTPTQPILVEIEPELQSLKVTDNESNKIKLLFSPAFASNNISDLCGNDFNITVDDVTPDISNIQLFHNTLIFELKQPIISNQVVQLQYIKPANQLNQFTFNNSVYSDKVFYFESHESVLSITNLVKPVFQSSIVRNDFFNKENEIFLTYNVDLTDNAKDISHNQFDIYDSRYTDENDYFHIDDIEIINNQIKIVLSRDINNRHYIKEGATIVLKYEPDLNPDNSNKNIIDKNGNSAIGFGNDGIIIDNRVLTRPTFSSVLATNGYDSSRLSDRLPENQITFTLNTPRDLSNNDICGNLINIFRRMVEIVTTTTTTFQDETEKVLQTVSTNIVNNGETADITITLDASLNWYQHLKYNYFNDSNFTKNIIDVSNIMVESFETGEYETDNIVINIHPTIGVSGEFNTEDKTFVVSSIDTEQKRIAFYDKNDPNSTFNQRIEYFQQTYEKEAYVDGLPRKKKFKIHPYPIDNSGAIYSNAFIEPDQKNIIVLQFHEEIEPNADISKNTFVIDMSGRINNTIDLEHRPNIDISSLTIDSSGQIIIELMDDARYLEKFSITYTKAGAGDPSNLYDAQGNEAEDFMNEMVDVSRLPNDDPPQFYDFGFGTDMVDMYMPIKQVTQADVWWLHTSIYYNNKMVLFGGYFVPNAVWELDLTTNVWNKLHDEEDDTSAAPTKRWLHTSIYYNNKMVVFGGTGTWNNVWEFDLTTNVWKDISPTTTSVNGLYDHTSIYYNNKMIVFGGRYLSGSWNNYSNDVWELDLTTNVWKDISPTTGTKPNRRRAHTSIYYDDKMVIFGGYNSHLSDYYLNDVWEFDLTTNTWSNITPTDETAPKPYRRNEHTSIYYNNKMVVFGGGYTGDNYLNDVWEFDLTTNTWSNITPTDETAPKVRSGHTSIYYNNKMIVFGGISGSERLNDLWEFDLTTNTWRDITPNPQPPVDMTTGDFSFPYHSNKYLSAGAPQYYYNMRGLRSQWKIDIHPPRNNYNNLEIIVVDEIDYNRPNRYLKIYGKNRTNPNIWDFGSPHDSIDTGVDIVSSNLAYNKSKLNRIGIDICNNIFVATNKQLNIYYYEGVNEGTGSHTWNKNNFVTLEFDFNITIMIVSGRDLILGFDYATGLYYYTMNEDNTWSSSKSSYKDIIAQDLYMYNHDPNAVRTVEVYKDTMVMSSFQFGWLSSSRASELDNPNFPFNTVRFYVKNNDNFFDNNYTTYTLSSSLIRFKLDLDVFVWIAGETKQIGIMKKNKRNEWPSVINFENNKNYFLDSCNDENHREVYVYNNLIYVAKGLESNYAKIGFRDQELSKIYKIITDETGQVTIEKDSDGNFIDYNPYPNNTIQLTIAGSGSSIDGYSNLGNSLYSINHNFVGNYFFYLYDYSSASNELFTKYQMMDMLKYSTDPIINKQKIEIEFTKDLSLNDLCGNDFIINDLIGQKTITNLELENDKFIKFILEDKMNTAEYIEIEYNPNIDPTFAIAEKLYNKPLTYFKYDSIIPFITNQVINRDNSNNIVITFNEKIDYDISPTFVNISFKYTDSYHNSLSAVPHIKDISKNIITLTPSSLQLTNDYKYIVTYTQGTDQNYNLKDISNNVSNFNVVFDFLPPEFTRIISYSPFYNVNSIDTTGNSAKINTYNDNHFRTKYRTANNYFVVPMDYYTSSNSFISAKIYKYYAGTINELLESGNDNNYKFAQGVHTTTRGLFLYNQFGQGNIFNYGYNSNSNDHWEKKHRVLLLTDDLIFIPNGLTKVSVYELPENMQNFNYNMSSTTLEVNHIPGSGYELYNYSWSGIWWESEKPYIYLYDYNKKQKHFMVMFKALAEKGSQWKNSTIAPTNASVRITNECHIFKYNNENNSWSTYDKVLRPSVSDQNGQILVNGYDSLQYCNHVPLSTNHNVIVTQFQGSQDGQWLQHALVYIYDENSGEWGLPHSHIDISGIVRIENYKLTYSGLMTKFFTSNPSWTYESNISLGNNRYSFDVRDNEKAQIHIQKNEILILELNKNNVEYNGIYVYNLNSDGSYGTREVIENIATEESTNHPTMYSEHYKITTSDMVSDPNVNNCIHAMAITETTLFALNVNSSAQTTNLYVYYRSHIYGKLDNNNNIIEHVKIGDVGLYSNYYFTYFGFVADQMFCTDKDLFIFGYRWVLNTFDYTDEDRENTIFCNISKDISKNDIDKNNFIVEDLSGDVYVTDIVPKEQAIVIETNKILDLNNIFIKYSKQGGTVENQQNVNIVDTTESYFMEDNEMLFGNWTPNNQTT